MFRFKDREQAGALLAQALQKYAHDRNAIVIGLPRGGVVVAYEVAKQLDLPLDVIVVRKIGAPMQPELAVGAVTADGQLLFNQDVMMLLGLREADLQQDIDLQLKEAQRRVKLFRGNRPAINLHGKTVIIVDDGVATGATVRAAIVSVVNRGAKHIILALPTAPSGFRATVADLVDEVILLQEESFFPAVGYFYEQFDQVEDDEVVRLLSLRW